MEESNNTKDGADTRPSTEKKEAMPTNEKERLLATIEAAREIVKPTVKRLKESESVSNDLLSMRLEKPAKDDGGEL